MQHSFRNLAAALALTAAPILAAAQPVPIVGLVELSGGGATVGTNFDNAIKMAVKEINAAGGLAGRKIEYTSFDTQTNPGVAKALAAKAIDQGAYVVMGPVFSGSIVVSMSETRRAEITNVVGGEAASITQQGNPVRLPDLVHAGDRDAQGRRLHQGHGQGEVRRRHLRQQRLRQGRARRDRARVRQAGRQGRRRHLHRPGPDRLLRRRCSRPSSRTPTRCSSTCTRRSRRASCASCASRATTSRSSARRRSPTRR